MEGEQRGLRAKLSSPSSPEGPQPPARQGREGDAPPVFSYTELGGTASTEVRAEDSQTKTTRCSADPVRKSAAKPTPSNFRASGHTFQ